MCTCIHNSGHIQKDHTENNDSHSLRTQFQIVFPFIEDGENVERVLFLFQQAETRKTETSREIKRLCVEGVFDIDFLVHECV